MSFLYKQIASKTLISNYIFFDIGDVGGCTAISKNNWNNTNVANRLWYLNHRKILWKQTREFVNIPYAQENQYSIKVVSIWLGEWNIWYGLILMYHFRLSLFTHTHMFVYIYLFTYMFISI